MTGSDFFHPALPCVHLAGRTAAIPSGVRPRYRQARGATTAIPRSKQPRWRATTRRRCAPPDHSSATTRGTNSRQPPAASACAFGIQRRTCERIQLSEYHTSATSSWPQMSSAIPRCFLPASSPASTVTSLSILGRVLRRQREQRHRHRARHVFEIPRSGQASAGSDAADLPGRTRRRRHQHGDRLAPGEAHGERQVGGHRQHQQARQREPDVPHPAQGGIHVAAPHQPTYRRRWLGGVALRRSTKSGRNQ